MINPEQFQTVQRFFFAGSSNIIDIYDTSTGNWSTINLPGAANSNGTIGMVGTNLILFSAGGFPPTTKVHAYDISSGSWTTTNSGLILSGGYIGKTLGSKVYFASGNNVIVYDNTSGSLSTMTLPTNHGSSVGIGVLGSKLYFAGGNLGGSTLIDRVDIFDTSTNQWTVASLSRPTLISETAVVGTKIFFVSGLDTRIDVYDSSTDVWSYTTYSSVWRASAAVTSTSDKLFIGGGIPNGIGNGPRSKIVDILVNPNTINFNPIADKTFGTGTFQLDATASSGSPVSYTSSNPGIVSISGSTASIVGVGPVTITASQPGNAANLPAVDVAHAFNVNKGSQAITFSALSPLNYPSADFDLTATASSSLPVTYSSSNTAIATVSDLDADNIWTVHIMGIGTVDITASQGGNDLWNPAIDVVQTLLVGPANQAITINALSPVNVYDPNFNLTATASSGLPVTYTSSNTAVATVSDVDADNVWTVDIVASGTANITASQPGNTLWNAAPDVIQPLVVKQTQTISFAPLASKTFGDAPFALSATATSGLTVTFASSDTNIASVSGGTVTVTGPGTVTITASQAGNGSFSPAPDVQQPLTVGLLSPTVSASFIEFTSVTSTSMDIGFVPGNGNEHLVVIKPDDPSNFFVPTNDVSYSAGYTSNGSTVVMSGTGNSTTVTGLSPSTKYYVKVFSFNHYNSSANYLTGCEANAAQTTASSGGGGGRVATSPSTQTPAVTKKDLPFKPFDIKILGNPFDDKLTFVVDSEEPEAMIALTDLTGRLIHESTIETNVTVEIEKPMASGVYLFKVNSGIDSKTVRVIKIE